MEHRETVYTRTRAGVAAWHQCIEDVANGAAAAVGGLALEDMTAELFDATPVVVLWAVTACGHEVTE